MIAMTTSITPTISMTSAAASLYLLISNRPYTLEVANGHLGETRKITVLTAVIPRTKENTMPEKNGCFNRGSVTLRKVSPLPAPRMMDASSIDRSICRSVDDPDSMDTDMFLKIKAATMINAVPVKINGFVLNALIYSPRMPLRFLVPPLVR